MAEHSEPIGRHGTTHSENKALADDQEKEKGILL
jgi:hypothetical protein